MNSLLILFLLIILTSLLFILLVFSFSCFSPSIVPTYHSHLSSSHYPVFFSFGCSYFLFSFLLPLLPPLIPLLLKVDLGVYTPVCLPLQGFPTDDFRGKETVVTGWAHMSCLDYNYQDPTHNPSTVPPPTGGE